MNQLLIAGLGNPGAQYYNTRHNLGALLIEKLAGVDLSQFKNHSKSQCLSYVDTHDSQKVHYVFPQQYMNLSGQALAQYCHYYKIQTSSIVVCYDDMDLPCGTLKLKLSGGHGGHGGLRNCIEHFKVSNFPRLRLGIDHPGHKDLVHSYVLKPFMLEQRELIDALFEKVLTYKNFILEQNWSVVQNKLNT